MNQELETTNTISEDLAQQLQATLNQTIEDIGATGVTVSVITPEGKWTGAGGIYNLETQQATKPNDLFNIASTSKPLTAVVILKLQEQGLLSLDDTIDKWLPEIAAQLTDGDNLTIRQILNGSGGLFDYVTNEQFTVEAVTDFLSGSTRDWQPEELVAFAFGRPRFQGETCTNTWCYTNTGYVIAALIAEAATGQSFAQILSNEILEPLKLDRTFFSSQNLSPEERAPGYEDIFTTDGELGQDGILDDLQNLNTEAEYGNGSLVSSASDVAKFFHLLARGDLLQPESTAEIFNFVSTGEGSLFGFGVFDDPSPWGKSIRAAGTILGSRSRVNYFPDNDTTIAVLANRASEFEDPIKNSLFTSAFVASIANTLSLNDTQALNGSANQEFLQGTSGNDIINGYRDRDTLYGGDGLDALDGGSGSDILRGGNGKDYLFGKEGNDLLSGGTGQDFLNGGVGKDFLKGGKDRDTLLGSQDNDYLYDDEGNDLLDGGAGDDILIDKQGNNSLYGNEGNDLIFAGLGDDILHGDTGNDRLKAGSGDDQLFGDNGDDYLNGGEGDDILLGSNGNDVLTGLSGSDTLSGGNGSDLFILSLEGTDLITDFTDGQDLLELPREISVEDIKIIQGQGENSHNTLITFQEEIIAIVVDVNVSDLLQQGLSRFH